ATLGCARCFAPVGTGSIYELDRVRTSAQWGRLCAARIAGSAQSILEACYLVHRICFEVLGMQGLHDSLISGNRGRIVSIGFSVTWKRAGGESIARTWMATRM